MTISRLVLASAALITLQADSRIQLPFDYLEIGEHRIKFNNQMTFNDSASLLGKSEVHHRGDAGTSLGWSCYLIEDDDTSTILILESSEMGGTERLTGFQLAPPGVLTDLELHCARLSLSPSDIVTDRGICLGMSRVEVEQILGSPTTDDGETITYSVFDPREGMWGDPPRHVEYSACSFLQLWFDDDLVVRMRGNRIDVS